MADKRSKTIFALTVLGVVLSAIGFDLGHVWRVLGAIGILLSIAAAWWQYKEPRRFELNVSEETWRYVSNRLYELKIDAATHQRGFSASVEVYQSNGDTFEKVECDASLTESGSVVIHSSHAISGKIVIT